jgi:phosphoglycolate phosphatase
VADVPAGTRPVLVLWDIDHTLIENNGVNKETYAKAFEALTGRRTEYPAVTEGRTDQDIMRNMLASNGIEPGADNAAAVFEALENALRSNIYLLRERGYVLPGAREALSELGRVPGIYQSVLSGNIRPNAFGKLSAFYLEPYIDFDIGGYGSDDSVRANLVRVAQSRATAKLHQAFDVSNTVVIGDTPRDVQAGRQGGAYVIAVASGEDSVERLSDEGADVVFADLADTRAVIDAIAKVHGR